MGRCGTAHTPLRIVEVCVSHLGLWDILKSEALHLTVPMLANMHAFAEWRKKHQLCLGFPLLLSCGLCATWLSITSTHGSSHAHNLSTARTELCKTHLGRPIC